jgi:DMSO reductase anchor subunit
LNPAFSVVFFTTLAGAGQGLVTALAVAVLAGAAISRGIVAIGLVVSLVLLVVALGASFLHLGRPERAWRAVLMWRTSWLSREVIVLPAFIALVALWLALRVGERPNPWGDVVLPIVLVAVSAVLWYCTGMIYACIRFIEEWAHPLTLVNYTLIGLASGLVLFALLVGLGGPPELMRPAAAWAFGLTVVAGAFRVAAIARNTRLRHRSTLQTATGIRNPRLAQQSMGMTGGSFNTREFMHGRTRALLARIKYFAVGAGFVVPALLLLPALVRGGGSAAGWLLAAALVQLVGVLAERWYFFAQARHPQNLYYQVVS